MKIEGISRSNKHTLEKIGIKYVSGVVLTNMIYDLIVHCIVITHNFFFFSGQLLRNWFFDSIESKSTTQEGVLILKDFRLQDKKELNVQFNDDFFLSVQINHSFFVCYINLYNLKFSFLFFKEATAAAEMPYFRNPLYAIVCIINSYAL